MSDLDWISATDRTPVAMTMTADEWHMVEAALRREVNYHRRSDRAIMHEYGDELERVRAFVVTTVNQATTGKKR